MPKPRSPRKPECAVPEQCSSLSLSFPWAQELDEFDLPFNSFTVCDCRYMERHTWANPELRVHTHRKCTETCPDLHMPHGPLQDLWEGGAVQEQR